MLQLIMWTNQPYCVYQQLKRDGIFNCDPHKSILLEEVNFQNAYQWMINQMKSKIGDPPKNVKVPIWAWYRSKGYQHCRPDFRWAQDYEDEVCMEIDIPEEQVLLSEFEEWHFVLSNSYLAPATSHEEYQRLNNWFESLTPKKQQRVKEKSWQQIFDITIRRQDEWKMNGEIVQGCFWQLKIDQVRKVWRLKKGARVREIN